MSPGRRQAESCVEAVALTASASIVNYPYSVFSEPFITAYILGKITFSADITIAEPSGFRYVSVNVAA